MPMQKAMAVNVRDEGAMIVAYLADPNTMVESELLASVNRGAFVHDEHVREGFKIFLRLIATRLVVGATGDEDAASKMEIQEVPHG